MLNFKYMEVTVEQLKKMIEEGTVPQYDPEEMRAAWDAIIGIFKDPIFQDPVAYQRMMRGDPAYAPKDRNLI